MQDLADVSPCIHMAEALLCWQADPRYYDFNSPWFMEDSDEEVYVEDEVVDTFCEKATAFFMASPGNHIASPNVEATADLICLARHILDPTPCRLYKSWLEGLIARLNKIVPNTAQTFKSRDDFDTTGDYQAYVRQNMGAPLPLEAANMSHDYDPAAGQDLSGPSFGPWTGRQILFSHRPKK